MEHNTLSAPDLSLQPVLFIPHGAGPCFFMDWQPAETWYNMADFLRHIAGTLPTRPSAILVVSAHWQAREFRITSGAQPPLIYDYYGFPEHTYRLTYPAPGTPALAMQIQQLLTAAGHESQLDAERGLDHGAFIPLKLMFPDADIPVVQLSLRRDLDSRAHIAAGQALAVLRRQGVLIVGSGMSFHNMRGFGDPRFTSASLAFDHWLAQQVRAAPAQRNQALSDWAQAPHAHQCHPVGHEEHLLPLMVAAGAAGQDIGHRLYSECVLETWLSGYRFG